MSDRTNYYFKQPVTESELNQGFTDAENADHRLMMDQGLHGIFSGGQVAQHSPLADLTVDVAGPMIGYDPNGQRVVVPGPTLNVNCAQDSSSVSTAVAGGGNEKWVSITAKFTRVLSDPRVDGNSNTVYFLETESYQIVVTQGGEAALGTATRPALDPDGLLLADVHRTFGQTQILNADIDATSATGRRQDTYVLAGTPVSIRAGFPKDAVNAMLIALNNHINNLVGHPASAIAYGGGAAWADGTPNAATDVEAQLDKIINDLGQGTGGTAKVSGAAIAGTRLTIGAAKLSTQLSGLTGAVDGILTNGADTIKQVADVAALRTILAANRPANAVAVVLGTRGLFVYDSTRLGADDGTFVIKPSDVVASAAGRWVSTSFREHLRELARNAMVWTPVNTAANVMHACFDKYRAIWYAVNPLSATDLVKYSPDMGANWFALTVVGGSSLDCFSIAVDDLGNLVIPNDSSVRVYAYNRLTNTWSNLATALAGLPKQPLVYYSSSAALWFIFYYDQTNTEYRVFTSPDRATWTDDTVNLPASFLTAPAAHNPRAGVGNGHAVVAGPTPGGVVKLAVRDLTGAGWTEHSLASALAITDITNPVYSEADGAWLIGVYGTLAARKATEIWRSTDDGATWTNVATLSHTNPSFQNPDQGPQFYMIASVGSLWASINTDSEISYSVDAGSTWYSAYVSVVGQTPAPPLNIYGGGGGFIAFNNAGYVQCSARSEIVNPVALS